jgi:prevent-host-death family protein
MCKLLPMKTIAVPIGEARTNLFELVEQTRNGLRVVITLHGRLAALLGPVLTPAAPWRMDKSDDPARNGDLQSPVMEPWP